MFDERTGALKRDLNFVTKVSQNRKTGTEMAAGSQNVARCKLANVKGVHIK